MFSTYKLPHQNPVQTSPVPRACNVPRPSHSSYFDYSNNIWRAVQIYKATRCLITKLWIF
jgi:hypothetical protein